MESVENRLFRINKTLLTMLRDRMAHGVFWNIN
jgi:hypothetical protein